MATQTADPGPYLVPEPEAVVRELRSLSERLNLTRKLLRLSVRAHGRPATPVKSTSEPAQGSATSCPQK